MRQCSFQAIEGPPQSKLLLTTTLIAFVTGLTTFLSVYPDIAMIILAMLLYCYCMSWFLCATFIRKRDQKMIFSGGLIGIIILASNIHGIYTKTDWGPYYYIGGLL